METRSFSLLKCSKTMLSKAYAVFKSFSRTGVSAYGSTIKLRTFELSSYARKVTLQKDKCPRAVKIRWERSKDAVLYKTVSFKKRTPCSKYTEKRGIFKALGGLGTDTREPPTYAKFTNPVPTYSILNCMRKWNIMGYFS